MLHTEGTHTCTETRTNGFTCKHTHSFIHHDVAFKIKWTPPPEYQIHSKKSASSRSLLRFNTKIHTHTERHTLTLYNHKSNYSAQATFHTHTHTHERVQPSSNERSVTVSRAACLAPSISANRRDVSCVSRHAVSISKNWGSRKLLKAICKQKHESKQARTQPHLIIKGLSIKWGLLLLLLVFLLLPCSSGKPTGAGDGYICLF